MPDETPDETDHGRERTAGDDLPAAPSAGAVISLWGSRGDGVRLSATAEERDTIRQ